MGKRITHEQYVERFNEINPTFKVTGEYEGMAKKIRIECRLCGDERYSEAKYNIENHLKCDCQKSTKDFIKKSIYKPRGSNDNSYKARISHEEFIKRFQENNTNADTLEILGRYVNSQVHIPIRCKVCSYEWNAHPRNLLKNNTGCRSCASSRTAGKKKYTLEKVKERLYSLYPNSTIQPISLTKRDKRNSKYQEVYCICKCGVCGGEWETRPADLFAGHGCPYCAKINLVTDQESFLARFAKVSKHKDDIELLSEYISCTAKIKCRCKICGSQWETTSSSLFAGHGCHNCANAAKGRIKPLDVFLEKFEKLPFHRNIEFNPDDYTAMKQPMNFICKKHETVWRTTPYTLLRSKCGCLKCQKEIQSQGLRKTHEQFLLDVKNKNPYFTVLSEYQSSKTKVLVRCELCKQEYWIKANDLLARGTCSKCSDGVSYPNKFSYAFLSQLPIENSTHEYAPEWAKGKRYDNYFEYQGQGYILEMDGKQHYLEYKGSRFKGVKEQQENDRYKDEMAKTHGIKVIRINCIDIYKKRIKDEILASELSNIFDLSNIDWDKCDLFARSNLIKDVWEYYNTNPLSVTADIAKEFSLSTVTIRRYLKQGELLGVIKYSRKDIHARMKQRRVLENLQKGKVD